MAESVRRTTHTGAKTAWADEETKLLKQKAIAYDGDTHAVNVYVNGAVKRTRRSLSKMLRPKSSNDVSGKQGQSSFPVPKISISPRSRRSPVFRACPRYGTHGRAGTRVRRGGKGSVAAATV